MASSVRRMKAHRHTHPGGEKSIQGNAMHLPLLKQIFTMQKVTQVLSDVPSALFTCLALAFVKNKIAA